MRHRSFLLVVSTLLVTLAMVAFSQSAEAAVFPEKGKTITFIVNQPAGGPTDVAFRVLAPAMEKELGVPVTVVNKPGATGQVGTTELVRTKPDGYTIGNTNLPSTLNNYLDPDRKAVFGRKDLQQVANQVVDPEALVVRAESPIKSVKDLVAAAKANPGGLKVGTSGLLSDNHMAAMLFQKAAGIQFAFVHFDGGAPATNALLGGHLDLGTLTGGTPSAHFRSGAVRYLAIMEREPAPLFPGVPTLESQGYKVYFASSRGISVRAGTPPEIVEILANAVKRAMESEAVKSRMEMAGLVQRYMGPAEYTKYWDDLEAEAKPLLEEMLKDQKK
jgi:tripartite-type tricarboxylate transporter receptor subunit TctC